MGNVYPLKGNSTALKALFFYSPAAIAAFTLSRICGR